MPLTRIRGTRFLNNNTPRGGKVDLTKVSPGTAPNLGPNGEAIGTTGGMIPQGGDADRARSDQLNAAELQREQATPSKTGLTRSPRVTNRLAPLPEIPDGTRRADMGTRMDETMPDTQQAWRGNTQPTSSPPPQVKPAPQQTERANPLTGDANSAPTGSTTDLAPPVPAVNPGQALGASSRNPSVAPRGQDMAAPAAEEPNPSEAENDDDGDESSAPTGGHMGGMGAYQKAFSNPVSAGVYDHGVRRIFGGQAVAGTQPKKPGLMKRIAPGSGLQPVDDAAA